MPSENDALVVVHAEGYPLDPNQCIEGEDSVKRSFELFGLIGAEIGVYIKDGKPVYFLRTMDKPNPALIHPSIEPYYRRMRLIPRERSCAVQFLKTKEAAVRNGLQRPSIVGIARGLCIDDVYRLLRGEDDGSYSKDEYEREAKEYANWTRRRFNRVFDRVLKPTICHKLTA